ncbi:MAG: TonB-dependent receptor, partial [Brevundimonas sp.]
GYSAQDIQDCRPLNIFGKGNQSEAALAYIDASVGTIEHNEQEQLIGSISGQLWDFWGAGAIGVAVGGEYRREYTDAIGRDFDTAGRYLFLNTGPNFTGAEYESEEVFAELSVPLFRDNWLGEYAELSGSYRYADYTTVGSLDVYGVNLVYRPVRDITFKTSFNTSVRVPDLGENFSPFSQTFGNGFVDPCATAQIALQGAEIRANRIANCTALAADQGLAFDFGSTTATTADDFIPSYTAGIPGVTGGNPDLRPEQSESFTFSTVIQPRWIPNLSIVLDYYEIEIEDVIEFPSLIGLADNCVSGTVFDQGSGLLGTLQHGPGRNDRPQLGPDRYLDQRSVADRAGKLPEPGGSVRRYGNRLQPVLPARSFHLAGDLLAERRLERELDHGLAGVAGHRDHP